MVGGLSLWATSPAARSRGTDCGGGKRGRERAPKIRKHWKALFVSLGFNPQGEPIQEGIE
uniref:Uncharacterized protein n=1 Tax=Arundo donax TaxID=35708 RepID=A0A0A9DNV4_ARUDO